MKHRFVFPESVLLSLLSTWGSVRCLISAFSLPVTMELEIGLVWLIWAAICALLMPRRHGVAACVLIALGGAAYLWYAAPVRTQLGSLLSTIARVYDSGYGWGVPAALRQETVPMDLILELLGIFQIFFVSRAVCCRKRTGGAVVALLVPLAACLVITDTVPSVPGLFALLLGVIVLLITSGVRAESGDQGTRLTLAVLVPTALALGLMFYLVPQESYVNKTEEVRAQAISWLAELPEKIQSGQIAVPNVHRTRDQVNLSSLSAQPQLRIPVAEVTAERAGPVYLRSQDYDRYTGTSWQSTLDRQETLVGTGGDWGIVHIQTLNAQSMLLLPSFPDGQTILMDGMAENDENLRDYSVRCRSSLLGPYPGEDWLVLPETTAARAKAILRRIPGDMSSIESTAAAIGEYVRGRAAYDRATRAMPAGNEDFALWFLEEAETGYCVHYATAAAVLLRSAGIPARYVTGYRAEVYGTDAVRVTSDEAHAWVEYYNYHNKTWSILEATPSDLTLEPTEPTEATATEPATVPTMQPQTTETTIPAETGTNAPTEESWSAPEQEPFRFPTEWLLAVLAVAAMWGVVEAQRLLRIRIRHSRQSRGSTNQQAAARWPELRCLFRLLNTDAPEELTGLTEKAMFSQHTLTQEELSRFSACAAASRKALQRAPWYKRLIYRYWYAVV